MDFKYSTIINPSAYEAEGLCDGIPLRRHRNTDREVKGAIRAQEDWKKLVGLVSNYNGALGDEYTFICVTVPECLPDRLEIRSYANEFAFLYDGKSSPCFPRLHRIALRSNQMSWRTLEVSQ